MDCRWCGAKPGDTVCPILGEPHKITWGEYDRDNKAKPKGRWCGIDNRVTFSYGSGMTKKHILKKKSDGPFVAGFQRRRERLIELERRGCKGCKRLYEDLASLGEEAVRQADSKIEFREKEQHAIKPRGKWVIYTEASYKLEHQNRSPQEDGYELGPIKLKQGKIIEGCRVWEGPKDVWECEDVSMQEIEKGTTLDDGRMVLDASQQDDIYQEYAERLRADTPSSSSLESGLGSTTPKKKGSIFGDGDNDDDGTASAASSMPRVLGMGKPMISPVKRHDSAVAEASGKEDDIICTQQWTGLLNKFKANNLEDADVAAMTSALKKAKAQQSGLKKKGASITLEIGVRINQVSLISKLLKAAQKVAKAGPKPKAKQQPKKAAKTAGSAALAAQEAFKVAFADVHKDDEMAPFIPQDLQDINKQCILHDNIANQVWGPVVSSRPWPGDGDEVRVELEVEALLTTVFTGFSASDESGEALVDFLDALCALDVVSELSGVVEKLKQIRAILSFDIEHISNAMVALEGKSKLRVYRVMYGTDIGVVFKNKAKSIVDEIRKDTVMVDNIKVAVNLMADLSSKGPEGPTAAEMASSTAKILAACTSCHCGLLSDRKQFKDKYGQEVKDTLVGLVSFLQKWAVNKIEEMVGKIIECIGDLQSKTIQQFRPRLQAAAPTMLQVAGCISSIIDSDAFKLIKADAMSLHPDEVMTWPDDDGKACTDFLQWWSKLLQAIADLFGSFGGGTLHTGTLPELKTDESWTSRIKEIIVGSSKLPECLVTFVSLWPWPTEEVPVPQHPHLKAPKLLLLKSHKFDQAIAELQPLLGTSLCTSVSAVCKDVLDAFQESLVQNRKWGTPPTQMTDETFLPEHPTSLSQVKVYARDDSRAVLADKLASTMQPKKAKVLRLQAHLSDCRVACADVVARWRAIDTANGLPAESARDVVIFVKVIAEQNGKATTFYEDLKAVGNQELQELERVYVVCSNELQRMGAEMLDKLWVFLDKHVSDNLMEVVNSLDAKILEEEKWADLIALFQRVFVKDGPLLKISRSAKNLDDTLKEIEKNKKVIVGNLIADDTYSSKAGPVREVNNKCKFFLVVMQGVRLGTQQFPSKNSKGEISASLREFGKFAEREKVQLGRAFKDWLQEAASDAERKLLGADAAVPAAAPAGPAAAAAGPAAAAAGPAAAAAAVPAPAAAAAAADDF